MPWGSEIRSRRSKRVHSVDNPARYRVTSTIAPMHFESQIDSGFHNLECDMALTRVNNASLNGWRVSSNGWHFAYQQAAPVASQPAQGTVAFGGRQGQHWVGLRPHRIGYLHWPTRTPQFISGPPDFSPSNLSQQTYTRTIGRGGPDPSQWTLNRGFDASLADIWTTPGGGAVRWQILGNTFRLKQNFRINQAARDWITANAPPTTPLDETWFGVVMQVEWRDIPRTVHSGQIVSRSDIIDTDGLQLRDALDRVLAHFGSAEIYVKGQPGRVSTRKRFWNDGTSDWLFFGARVDQMQQVLLDGELVIDPPITQEEIAANADDASERENGTTALTGFTNRLYMGTYLGTAYHTGLRFTPDIDQGDTIADATLTLYRQASAGAGNPSITIYCEDDDGDAAAFTDAGNPNSNITGRTLTTASVVNTAWGTADNSTFTVTGLDAIVEEAVANVGWAANNGLVFVMLEDESQTGTNNVGIEDFSHSLTNEALFDASIGGGANPKGPLGMPLHGPLAGPTGI